jgi:hypothetical protein
MSTATSGRAREYKVRDALAKHGWELIARSAGSKGPADLVMAHEWWGAALIQVGTENKRLGPDDRTRLLRAASLCDAIPLVAQVIPEPGKPTRITYWQVIDGPPSTWTEWSP